MQCCLAPVQSDAKSVTVVIQQQVSYGRPHAPPQLLSRQPAAAACRTGVRGLHRLQRCRAQRVAVRQHAVRQRRRRGAPVAGWPRMQEAHHLLPAAPAAGAAQVRLRPEEENCLISRIQAFKASTAWEVPYHFTPGSDPGRPSQVHRTRSRCSTGAALHRTGTAQKVRSTSAAVAAIRGKCSVSLTFASPVVTAADDARDASSASASGALQMQHSGSPTSAPDATAVDASISFQENACTGV